MKLMVKKKEGSSGRVHLVDTETSRGLMLYKEGFYWTTVSVIDVPDSHDIKRDLLEKGYASLELDVPVEEFDGLYCEAKHKGTLGEFESFRPSETPTLRGIIEEY